MSELAAETSPCWCVEWSNANAYPYSRIFYSDVGQTLDDVNSWIDEISERQDTKHVKLCSGRYYHQEE